MKRFLYLSLIIPLVMGCTACKKFPGMLKERTFNLVWVRESHGIGVEPSTDPDRIIKYIGKQVVIRKNE